MGTKRTGCRKYLFLYLACGVTFFLVENGCIPHRAATRPDEKTTAIDHAASSVGNDSTDISDSGTLLPLPGSGQSTSEHLNAAYLALAAGSYTTASLELEQASAKDPPLLHSEAIYLTALLYADPENPSGDMGKARETLQGIDKEHPGSDRAVEARILVGLLETLQSTQTENQRLLDEISQLEKKLVAEQNSIQRLKNLMKKLKEIDLGLLPEEQ